MSENPEEQDEYLTGEQIMQMLNVNKQWLADQSHQSAADHSPSGSGTSNPISTPCSSGLVERSGGDSPEMGTIASGLQTAQRIERGVPCCALRMGVLVEPSTGLLRGRLFEFSGSAGTIPALIG